MAAEKTLAALVADVEKLRADIAKREEELRGRKESLRERLDELDERAGALRASLDGRRPPGEALGVLWRVLKSLVDEPKADVRGVARSVYGSDGNVEVQRVRVQMTLLKQKKFIARVGRGAWETTASGRHALAKHELLTKNGIKR